LETLLAFRKPFWKALEEPSFPGRRQGLKIGLESADMRVMQDERRSEVRMLCADMVEVCWRDRAGRKFRETGLLEDISASGACLQMETPVPLGTSIHWDSPKRQFTGLVQYCVYREIGYFIGVEFDFTSRWSKTAYRPQHLLDLQQLLNNAKK
jgi:hypothetical protein